jgi:hypothetical protein
MADPQYFGLESHFNEDVHYYKSIYVSNANGIIMTSPSGIQYKLVVSDDGTLSTKPLS